MCFSNDGFWWQASRTAAFAFLQWLMKAEYVLMMVSLVNWNTILNGE
jgi:hypothetical protein